MNIDITKYTAQKSKLTCPKCGQWCVLLMPRDFADFRRRPGFLLCDNGGVLRIDYGFLVECEPKSGG